MIIETWLASTILNLNESKTLFVVLRPRPSTVLLPSGTWVPFNATKPAQTKIGVTMESDKNKSTLTNLAPKGKKIFNIIF